MSGTDKNIAILGRVGANIRERHSQHGDAVKTHRVIAQLWSAYLEIEVQTAKSHRQQRGVKS